MRARIANPRYRVYTLNRETGEVRQVGKDNDEKDRILKTDSKSNVKKKGEGFLGFLVPKSERGKEKVAIGGTYASENSTGKITHMTIGKYEGNRIDKIKGGLGASLLYKFYNLHDNPKSLLGHFHVHPGGTREPSGQDRETRDSWKDQFKSSMFNILINSNNKSGYESIPY